MPSQRPGSRPLRRSTLTPLIASLVLVALAAVPWPVGLAATHTLTEAQREAKAAELERLRERIDQTRKQLETIRGRHDKAQAELRRTERRIGKLVRGLKHIAGALDAKGRRLAELHHDQKRLQGRLAEQRKLLAEQVRAAYAIGRQEYVKMLLNQQDPAALGRVTTYYDYFNRARAKRIRAALATLDKLNDVKQSIVEEQQKLQALQDKRRRDKRELEASYHQREAVVVKLNAQIHSKSGQLSRMEANEKALKQLLDALRDVLADIPAEPGNRKPFPDLKGKLTWPVRGRVEDLFGHRQLAQLKWNGVVIRAPQGRKVRAISHGRVAFADWLRGYGLLIIIDHGHGYMSLYGHNQSLYKETGDWVEPGEVIATVGASGGQARAGLYFEIRHNGRPVDPARWCGATRSAELSSARAPN
ncbi:MAG TPA: peptidoglycan DD-metalloendopeptidase family protein [Gammaproteobacteria bacterium]|nr:peptidoglycan DD-metalloendopeptidase family protein [Gammaproteobacteria bacterium]